MISESHVDIVFMNQKQYWNEKEQESPLRSENYDQNYDSSIKNILE